MKVLINESGMLDDNGAIEVRLNGSHRFNKDGGLWEIYFEDKDTYEYLTAKCKEVIVTKEQHRILYEKYVNYRLKCNIATIVRRTYGGKQLTENQLDRILEIVKEAT